MVLRAFAAHPRYRRHPGVVKAGTCLKSRIFHADAYDDRKAPAYWLKFQFPFWWTSLVTALDTLQKLGFSNQETELARGLDWFGTAQEADGLWPSGYEKGSKAAENRAWVGLAICRVLSRA